MADGGDLVMLLDNDQLKKLALLIRNNEEPLMSQIIKSQNERAKYLKSVNDSYDNTISLIDSGADLTSKYAQEGADGDTASIAHDIFEYIKYGINTGLQNIRSCTVRVTYVEKLRSHFDSLATELAELDPKDLDSVGRMAEEMAKYKAVMKEYTQNLRSSTSRALSKAWSMVIKQEGTTFPDLVNKHKNKLGFNGEFEALEDSQKLEVYNSIIEESGRAKMPSGIASTAVGVAVLLVTAGVMVWDIFTAEHKLETILDDSLTVLSDLGGFAVQVVVEAAVTEAVADLELGIFVVSVAGFVAGSVAGLVFVAVGGWLLDLIFGTGGNQAPPVTDLEFHTAHMPDGMSLANQIVHDLL